MSHTSLQIKMEDVKSYKVFDIFKVENHFMIQLDHFERKENLFPII